MSNKCMLIFDFSSSTEVTTLMAFNLFMSFVFNFTSLTYTLHVIAQHKYCEDVCLLCGPFE